MKNRAIRLLALVMLLALVVGATPAMAVTKDTTRSIVNETLYTGIGEYYMKINNWTWEEKNVVTKSSDPSVLAVDENEDNFCLIPKKAGKATITVTYKVNKKKYKISNRFTVEKYPNAISSLTINKQKVQLSGSRMTHAYYECDMDKKVSVTINLKPKSGWKIASIKAYTLKTWSTKGKKTLTVKNNKKFTVAKDREAYITYTLKKGKKTFAYTINVERAGE